MTVLLTGGAGYIGSHTAIELINSGHSVIVVDNLSNSSEESINRVRKITNSEIMFYNSDVRDKDALRNIFNAHQIDAVIHFAGLKSVGESVANPLEYYRNNIDSTLSLLEVTQELKMRKLVFSSSATVYGDPAELPLHETSRVGLGITNPYGWTKFMIEQILKDVSSADNNMEITTLRYFNPVGAHDSGLIGEDPSGIPNNLMPYVSQVAVGKRNKLTINGNDYDTPDGTCLRDYIHVVDLAIGHVAALEKSKPGCEVYNLGTGNGLSVLEVIRAFEKASGRKIPYDIGPRRAGDIASNYADATKAQHKLNWLAMRTIDDMCESSWKWQSQNPDGYSGD